MAQARMNRFAKARGCARQIMHGLIWLGGMIGITWIMPMRFEPIAHGPNERIIGFCGHKLVSVTASEPEGVISTIMPLSGGEGVCTAGPILVRDIDTLAVRTIDFPVNTLLHWCQLIPTRHWLCAQDEQPVGTDSRIFVIDLESGKHIKVLPCALYKGGPAPRQWCMSDDGRTLAFLTNQEHGTKLRCIDISSEQFLWERPDEVVPVISPDNRFIAFSRPESIDIRDLRSGRQVCSIPRHVIPDDLMSDTRPREFSRDGSLLVDDKGNVWNACDGKQRLAGSGFFPEPLFTGPNGKWLIYRGEDRDAWPTLTLTDCYTSKEIYAKHLVDVGGLSLNQCVPDNRVIWLDDSGIEGMVQPGVHPMLRKAMRWLPWLGMFTDAESDHHCLLVDPLTGETVFQTHDHLQAVTDDGRFFVTETKPGAPWRLYELPVRRSLLVCVLGCLIWSVALADIGLLRDRGRRRGKLRV